MRHFAKHINLFTYTFAFLFSLGNAGFTTILHVCCVEDGDETAHEFAEAADGHSHHDEVTDEHSHHDEITNHEEECTPLTCDSQCIVNPDDGCHKQVLAGGLDDIQAVVEKSHTKAFSKVTVLQVVALAIVIPTSIIQKPHSAYFFRERSHPPPVEKYVLNETFLI